jgi:hypothetical protein
MSHTTPASHQGNGLFSEESPGALAADDANVRHTGWPIDLHFAAALRSIINRSYEPPKSPNNRYYEFMAYLYRKLVNAEPYESHQALHALNILQEDERMPGNSRRGIRMFFEYASEMMAISWKVYKDYKHALANQSVLRYKQHLLDIASFTIHDCPDCFIRLVRNKAITASGFNSTGQSYFRLAFCEDRVDIARELLSEMGVEHILEPAYIIADGRQQTILQMSVMNAELFNACWTKIESNPGLHLSNVIEHEHCAYVCGFATKDLAMRMLARGIDLANTVRALPYATWPRMAQYQPSPASIFSWLMQRGCCPYSTEAGHATPLLVAAQHDRFEATSWLLWNNFNADEQRSCAIAAAVRQTKDSACIFDLVMTRMSLAVPPHPLSWPQEVACEVIQAACDENRAGGAENIEFIQDLAIRKLQSVKASAAELLVYSKESLSSAKRAGLTDLVNFLRGGNKEALNMLEDCC